MRDDVLVLVSEKAGGTDGDSLGPAVSTLAHSFNVEMTPTSNGDELETALAAAAGRLVVIAGGDGSLHAVVSALHRRGELAHTDLALLPLGTGNDFARALGLPLAPADAAAMIVDAVRRPLDLLVDDRGDVAVNVVHAGVGAEAATLAASLKPVLGAAGYPLGAVLAGATVGGWQVTVTVDGVVVHDVGEVLMVALCNGRSIGGGTELCPVADPGDGLVDVVVVTATELSARVAFGAALRKGEQLDRDDVVHVQGRSVGVHGELIGYNCDGEIGDEVASRHFDVLPGAWTLRTKA